MRFCYSFLIFSALLSFTTDKSRASQPTTRPADPLIFISWKNGFSLVHPENWKASDSNHNSHREILFATDKGCWLRFSVMNYPTTKSTVEEYISHWMITNAEAGRNLKVISDKVVNIDGARATQLMVASSNAASADRSMTTIVAKNDRIYVAIYSGVNNADLEKGLPEVDRMLQTMKLIPIPAAKPVRHVFY